MKHCPTCRCDHPSHVGIAGDLDVMVRRLGPVTFDEPVRLARPGLYVVGKNEDGRNILTRSGEAPA